MMIFAALNLLLVAGVALGQTFPLNMMEDCVDDQYTGSLKEILARVDESFRRRQSDEEFKEALTAGQQNCTKGSEMGLNESIALYVYTYSGVKDLKIHKAFNDATRNGKSAFKAGTYPWYFLHYWLTKALQALKKQQTSCLRTYRGTNVHFTVDNKKIRFGAFTSTSTDRKVAEDYGKISCFETYTCHGASIVDYSANKSEKEVLIPPYEAFHISEVQQKRDKPDLWCETVYVLKSTGAKSYSCQSLCVASVCLIIVFIYERFLH